MSFVNTATGTFYNRSLSQMSELRGNIERLQTQIATGKRLERGSDDPAAAAQLRQLARREILSTADASNAASVDQDLTSATTELAAVTNLLQRARELALGAASDTSGAAGREAIAFEIEQLGEELFARANAEGPGGEPLFAGLAAGPAFTRDGTGAVTYTGTTQSLSVPVGQGTEIERGLDGAQLFEFDVAGSPSNAFAVLRGLADALRGGTPDPSASASAAIDAALTTVNRGQTILGARLAWVETVRQEQLDRSVAIAERRSEVGDTQIGDAIAKLQQSMTALEASQAAFTRVSSLTLFNAL